MTTAGHARLAVELEQLAVELVTGAADVVRGLGRRDLLGHRDLSVGTKSTATDLVTQVDRAAERWLVEHLAATRPDDAVLGEEGGARPGSSPVRWLIDPIDGTVNFVLGIPHYAVSVAAELDGVVVAGAVVDVVSGETFRARRGAGAWLNETALSGPRDVPMERAVIGTGFGYDAAARTRQISIVAELLPRIADIRRMGAASLDLCSVAAGRLDGYWERNLQPWDMAAGQIMVREAGGTVSGIEGNDDALKSGNVICGNEAIHAELVKILKPLGK